jgi:hypothetical protein
MPLTALRDGAVAKSDGKSRPLPLMGTTVDIEVTSGIAVTTISRRFCNAEADPIEVLMTFPVGFHSAVTGLKATIDERVLTGRAQPKNKARETYEEALEKGELAVLHEEPLRGLNVLSIAPLPPGAEVDVCIEIVTPLSLAPGGAFLRLPMTIGEVYGDSPLLPADDVLAERGLSSPATLTLRRDAGTARLMDGRPLTAEGLAVELNKAIEIMIDGGTFGLVRGTAADGRHVELTLAAAPVESKPLSCAILFDRSGSTDTLFAHTNCSVWQAMRDGLADVFAQLSDADEIALWQFDNSVALVGKVRGAAAAQGLLKKLGKPAGGTELIGAVVATAKAGARQILVLTDGQTWATQAPADLDACMHAVLIGSASLDAGVGHLAAQTGGEVFYASGRETAAAIASGLRAMRSNSSRATGKLIDGAPIELACSRSGVTITTRWEKGDPSVEKASDAIGRFAASLALPLFSDDEAGATFAAAHDLACRLTSLVLVDPQTTSEPGLPRTIRQPLAVDVGVSYSRSSISMSASSIAPMMRVEPERAERYCRMDSAEIPQFQSPARKSLQDRIRDSARRAENGIDWSLYAVDFLANDLATLPPEVLAIVQAWALEAPVQRIAKLVNQPALLVALALYAENSTNRNALRFKNKVLAGINTSAIQEALAFLAIS